MIIRFEVAERKSWGWPHFVERAKKHGKHKVVGKGGGGTHIVVCSTMDDAVEIWQVVRSWQFVSYLVDGQMVGRARMNDVMMKYQFRDLKQKWMLDDIVEKVQKKRDDGEAESRRRMGLD